MSDWRRTVLRGLPGVWAGLLLCVAFIATPAPFATLATAEAGKVVAHIFAREAGISVVLAVAILLLERAVSARAAEQGGERQASQMTPGMMLALGALFCTVAGYYGLQPLMAQARLGQGSWTFGQLHAVSLGFFLGKLLMVLALAWRAIRPGA